MSAFDRFVLVAVPVAYTQAADAMMLAAGYCQLGDTPHQIPLSADGSAPATHLGWWAYTSAAAAALLASPALPALDWGDVDLVAAEAVWESRIVPMPEPAEAGKLAQWASAKLTALRLVRLAATE